MAKLIIQAEAAGVGELGFRAGDYIEHVFEFKQVHEDGTLSNYVFSGTPQVIIINPQTGEIEQTLIANVGTSGVTLSGNVLTWGFSYSMQQAQGRYYAVREVFAGNRPDTLYKGLLKPQFDLEEYSLSEDDPIIIEKKSVTLQINITKIGGGGTTETGTTIVAKLTGLTGTSRLSYNSLKDTPTPVAAETGTTIKTKLNGVGEYTVDATQLTAIGTIGNKSNSASPTFTGTVTLPATTSIGSVSSTEIGYLDGVTSSIQSQFSAVTTAIGNKQNTISFTTTGTSGAATFNPTTGALNIPNYTTAGSTPADGSITDAKMASDVKLGSLAALTTTIKTSFQAAINELVSSMSGLVTIINSKVTSNANITAGTKAKITYDVKGLVTAGADLVEADIPALPTTKITGLDTAIATAKAEAIADAALPKDTRLFNKLTEPFTHTPDKATLGNIAEAGRHMLGYYDVSGVLHKIQSAVGRGQVSYSQWHGVGSGVSHVGTNVTIETHTNGTLVASSTSVGMNSKPVSISTGSGSHYLLQPRTQYYTPIAAGSTMNIRGALNQLVRNNGAARGGFMAVLRFGLSLLPASCRGFFGLGASNGSYANVNPSTFLNVVGVGWDAGQTTLRLIHNDGVNSSNAVDLGTDFPCNTTETDFYQLQIFCKHDVDGFYYMLINESTSKVATGFMSTNIPAANTLLTYHLWISNNTATTSAAFDPSSTYFERHY